RERDGGRVPVQQVHVARSAGERTRGGEAVADVLNSLRRVAVDDPSLLHQVETEGWDSGVLAMEDDCLAVGSCGRQAAEPSTQAVAVALQQFFERGAVALIEGASKVGIRQRVYLQHDKSAILVRGVRLAAKQSIFHRIVPAQNAAGRRRDCASPLHSERSEEHTSELQSRENLVC